jgi:ribosomal protein L39E
MSFGYTHEVRNKQMYAALDRDECRICRDHGINRQSPPAAPSIPVRIRYSHEGVIRLHSPFDRFYMEEHLAPVAETVYRSASRSDATNTFAIVRVYEHFPVSGGSDYQWTSPRVNTHMSKTNKRNSMSPFRPWMYVRVNTRLIYDVLRRHYEHPISLSAFVVRTYGRIICKHVDAPSCQ